MIFYYVKFKVFVKFKVYLILRVPLPQLVSPLQVTFICHFRCLFWCIDFITPHSDFLEAYDFFVLHNSVVSIFHIWGRSKN